MKNIQGEKYSIFTEKRYFPLNSKFKQSEIWNKFISLQRKWFLEQSSTNKLLKNVNIYKNFALTSYC